MRRTIISVDWGYHFLISIIIQVFELLILLISAGQREIHAWHDAHLSAGLLLKRLRKGGIHFYM